MAKRMGDLLCAGTPTAGVREEHVDVILCEEALLDPCFGDWIARTLGLGGARVIDAVSSFWSGTPARESDIVMLFESDDLTRTLVHVENKIATRLSDEQIDGYETRIRDHAALLGTDCFRTAIIAPQGYIDWQLRSARFDYRISYEDIIERIDGDDPRRRLRADVLRAGIERFDRLGIPRHDEEWLIRRHANLRCFRFETRHPLVAVEVPLSAGDG